MELLYILLVLLFTTRLFGELAERLGQPPLVGELVSGIILGTLVNRFSDVFPVLAGLQNNHVFNAITDLAIFFLMLLAGIEMHPRKLAEASTGAFVVALGGMIVPMLVGLWLGWSFIPDSEYKVAQILFVATSLAITAVPVAVKILMDLGKLQTRLGQTIISAAVIDDVLSLLLLAVLTSVIKTGGFPNPIQLLFMGLKILTFFVVTGLIGHFIFPLGGKILKSFRTDEIDFSGLLVAALSFAVFAEMLGMHFILGAFMAGVFFIGQTVGQTSYRAIKERLSGITEGFLGPMFFASIGMHLDITAAGSIPLFVLLLTIAAFLCKLVGAGLPAYWLKFSPREAIGIGVGMSARGAVELIIADVALSSGLFLKPQPLPSIVKYMFSAVVIMALTTTLLTPIVLKQIVGREVKKKPKPTFHQT